MSYTLLLDLAFLINVGLLVWAIRNPPERNPMIRIVVEVKIGPSNYKTITIGDEDLLRLAEQKAEKEWACQPSARAQSFVRWSIEH